MKRLKQQTRFSLKLKLLVMDPQNAQLTHTLMLIPASAFEKSALTTII